MRFFSNEDPKKDEEGGGRKVPKGFEKFLKKTKKGINHEEKSTEDKKEKKESKQQDDEDLSDIEEPGFSKKDEKKNEKSYYESFSEKAEGFKDNYLMTPGGGGPRWGLLLGFLGISYLGYTYSGGY